MSEFVLDDALVILKWQVISINTFFVIISTSLSFSGHIARRIGRHLHSGSAIGWWSWAGTGEWSSTCSFWRQSSKPIRRSSSQSCSSRLRRSRTKASVACCSYLSSMRWAYLSIKPNISYNYQVILVTNVNLRNNTISISFYCICYLRCLLLPGDLSRGGGDEPIRLPRYPLSSCIKRRFIISQFLIIMLN